MNTNKKSLNSLQKIIRDAVWIWKIPMIAKTLAFQTTLVAVNQPATKKPRLKKQTKLDVSD
jgi:hypothetical protein